MTNELPLAEGGLSARWGIGHGAALAVILSIGLWLGSQERLSEDGTGGDEATYVALSHSLAQGHYRDEFLVGTPPHAKYPPGNAVWLWLLRGVAGPDLDVVRFANLLLLVISALLTGDAVRRLASPWAGVGAAAVVVLNPLLIEISGTVLSEPPYIAMVSLATWAYLRGGGADGWAWELVGYTAALGAFLTRSAGLAVLAAVTLMFYIRKRWLAGALAGTGMAVVVGGWFAYVDWAGRQGVAATYAKELFVPTVRPLVDAGRRVVNYLGELPDYFALPSIQGTPVDNFLWDLFLVGCGGVAAWVFVRRWPVQALTFAGSIAVVVGWRFSDGRLIVPLIPAGVALLVVGAHTLGNRRSPRVARMVGGSLAILFCVSAVAQHRKKLEHRNCDGTVPFNRACHGARDRRLVAAAEFAGQSLPTEAVIATSSPATVYHFSRRRTLNNRVLESIFLPDPAPSLASFGFTHIVLHEVRNYDWVDIAPQLYRYCGLLRIVVDFPPATVLFALRELDTGDGEACRYLRSRIRPVD